MMMVKLGMKTVSTKLDSKIHNKFVELCNNEGKCQSEFLRDMIEDMFEDDENRPPTHQDLEDKPITEARTKFVSYDDGTTWTEIQELENVRIVD